MPDRNLTAGSAAAIATLLFFAGQDAAQAARCPLGEIYRPSRGVCVSKQQAIQAGVYRGSAGHVASRMRVAALVDEPAPVQAAPIQTAPTPKPRPQALAEIERRAPAVTPKTEDALAFVTDRKSAASSSSVASLQGTTEQARPNTFSKRPEPSPFGSLVALEPMP
ncbi:MAG TPA: hypothetical protein VLI91_04835 [Roseiarcus sp.]|nr:hypothetical protein [Roseiarcus sp.]